MQTLPELQKINNCERMNKIKSLLTNNYLVFSTYIYHFDNKILIILYIGRIKHIKKKIIYWQQPCATHGHIART